MKLFDPIGGIKTIAGFPGEKKANQPGGLPGLPQMSGDEPLPAGTAKEEAETTQANEQGTALTRTSVLDQVVHTLFGRPNSEKTPEEQKESAGKRGEAGNLAAGAAKNPGAAFMGIPSGGSNEFGGGTIQTVLQLIGGLFGGGGAGGGAGK